MNKPNFFQLIGDTLATDERIHFPFNDLIVSGRVDIAINPFWDKLCTVRADNLYLSTSNLRWRVRPVPKDSVLQRIVEGNTHLPANATLPVPADEKIVQKFSRSAAWYALIASQYVKAARIANVSPSEFQAVVWVVWRNLKKRKEHNA